MAPYPLRARGGGGAAPGGGGAKDVSDEDENEPASTQAAAAAGPSSSAHRFHLPIPSVFRPSSGGAGGAGERAGAGARPWKLAHKHDKKLGVLRSSPRTSATAAAAAAGSASQPRRRRTTTTTMVRPATMAELAEAAAAATDPIFHPSIPIRRFLAGAQELRTQAQAYLGVGGAGAGYGGAGDEAEGARAGAGADYERAFICLAKAARLLIDILPNRHPGYKSDLTPSQRAKAARDGQAVLDEMGRIKPMLLERFERWRAAHPEVKDFREVPTALSVPGLQDHLFVAGEEGGEEEEEQEQKEETLEPSPSSSSNTLRTRRAEPQDESFDVRSILGYHTAAAMIVGGPPPAPASMSKSGSSSSSSITYSPASGPSSSSIEPWSTGTSASTTTAPHSTTSSRFAYPILRRSSTQRSAAPAPLSTSARRQQTTDSTASVPAPMTPDQSGQGFAPRTVIGESYYASALAQQSFAYPWEGTSAAVAAAAAPALPPLPAPPPVPPPPSLPAASSTPPSPAKTRQSGVSGPRPWMHGSSSAGSVSGASGLGSDSAPPRPAKSLTLFTPAEGTASGSGAASAPALPGAANLVRAVQPTPPPPPSTTTSPPSLPLAQLEALHLHAGTTSPEMLPSIEEDGGGSRLEQHATHLLTIGRHHALPQAMPSSSSPGARPPPPPLPERHPQRPSRPQRSATEEEEAQLAWALEESRKEMEVREQAALASAQAYARAVPPSASSAPAGMVEDGAMVGREGDLLPPPVAYTEGGTPLRTVILPTRVLTLFLALARPNTEANIETCALLMGHLRPPPTNDFLITHLTVPAQSGASDRCETHDEEAVWDVQERAGLVTVGWIHTHPTQSAFLSSADLHQHCSLQAMTPEAIAIVCAPRHEPSFGLFRLTDPHGVQTIMHCRAPGMFHPHVTDTGDDIPALYTDALHGHVKLDPGAHLTVVDLR